MAHRQADHDMLADRVGINVLMLEHHHHQKNNTNNVANTELASNSRDRLLDPNHHPISLFKISNVNASADAGASADTHNNSHNSNGNTYGCDDCHGRGGDDASDDGDGNGDDEFVREYESGGSSVVDMKKKRVMGECRICQEEDEHTNLESPCACSGSLKFAHRKCVQHWCDEKGDTTCEICLQHYVGDYTAPTLTFSGPSTFPINIGNTAGSQAIDLHEPRIFTVAPEHIFSESDYQEYARANHRSAMCLRSVALVLMVVLLLRHILSMTTSSSGGNNGGHGAHDEEAPTFFLLFLLRAAGFFLPCYIMGQALNMIQGRRQRQSLAASEVAYILQTGIQSRGVHIAMAPTI